MRPTLEAILPCLTADRDARIETVSYDADLACVCLDDAGQGEFERVITAREAAELLALGLVQDAR